MLHANPAAITATGAVVTETNVTIPIAAGPSCLSNSKSSFLIAQYVQPSWPIWK